MKNQTFRSLGGSFQLMLEDAEDLAKIHELDPARWAVTSIPTQDLLCDPVFLSCLDEKKNGRILVSQVIAARDWLLRMLSGRSHLHEKTETLNLSDLDVNHEEGRALRKTAERILTELKAEKRESLSLGQLREQKKVIVNSLANGDGIICPEVIPELETEQFVRDVIATVGSVTEMSGRAGIGVEGLEKFLSRGKAYLEWREKGKGPDGGLNPTLFPWGADTAVCAASVDALDAKIEQFFWQCDLVREEPAAAARFRLAEDQAKTLEVADPAAIEKHLKEASLAQPNPEGMLPLAGTVNSYYRVGIEELAGKAIARALGRSTKTLSREQWRQVKAVFDPYREYQKSKPPEPFEKLDPEKLSGYLSGPAADRVRYFIDLDKAAAPELAQMENLEKLLLYQRWLLEFCSNFVSLSVLYNPTVVSLFERGCMVVDGRRLEFSIEVTKRDEHKKVAAESKLFIIYARISEKSGTPLFEIAAPVTRGERGRLIVGKRGIFITVSGKVYDAQIVDIVENPISLIEAIKAPFRRTAEFINKKIEEFAASKSTSAEGQMKMGLSQPGLKPMGASAAGATAAPAAAAAPPPPAPLPPPPAPVPPPKRMDAGAMAGVMAGAGLAIAALGSAVTFALKTLSDIKALSIITTVVSIVAVIVLFSALLGWLKLRRRNLGPFFEACGWAVNPQMKVSGRLARVFNRYPALPAGHVKDHSDMLIVLPPEESDKEKLVSWKRVGILLVIVLIVVFLALVGYFTWTVKRDRPAEAAPSTSSSSVIERRWEDGALAMIRVDWDGLTRIGADGRKPTRTELD